MKKILTILLSICLTGCVTESSVVCPMWNTKSTLKKNSKNRMHVQHHRTHR